MKEQSQIDDMRAAIRGDIERGRARPRQSPIAQHEAQSDHEQPPAPEVPRPGLLASLFKRA
jgi:hypothetical protein